MHILHTVPHEAFDLSVRLGLFPRNLWDVVSPPRKEEHEITTLSPEQVQQLLTAEKDRHLEALFVSALMTGMRRGELLALKWQDVNFAESTLYIRGVYRSERKGYNKDRTEVGERSKEHSPSSFSH